MVTPHLEQPKCLPASSQHLTASTSLPLSTDRQEVYFIPRPRNKALAAVKNQNQYICIYIYIYILIYIFILIFIYIYIYIHSFYLFIYVHFNRNCLGLGKAVDLCTYEICKHCKSKAAKTSWIASNLVEKKKHTCRVYDDTMYDNVEKKSVACKNPTLRTSGAVLLWCSKCYVLSVRVLA